MSTSRALATLGALVTFGALGALVALGALGACASVLGIDPPIERQDAGAGVSDASADQLAVDGGGGGESGSPCGSAASASAASATCVDAPPPGWDGPFAYFLATGGPPAPDAPSCVGAYPTTSYDGKSDLRAAPATCTCTCAAPTGIVCAPPAIDFFSDATCTTSCGTIDQPLASAPSCTTLGLSGCSGIHLKIGGTAPDGGSCAPSATTARDPADWSTVHRLCGGATPLPGACDRGQVCVPSPTLPAQPGVLCIAQPGDVACPPGTAYGARHVAFASFSDDRGCSSCTCGAPAGATCAPQGGTLYGDTGCAASPKAITVPLSTCTALSQKSANMVAIAPSGGSCARDGGAPIGAAVPTTPTTICCTR